MTAAASLDDRLPDLPHLPLVPVLLALHDARHDPTPRAHHALTRATLGAPLRVARALLALEDAGLADARRARLTPAGHALAARLATEVPVRHQAA